MIPGLEHAEFHRYGVMHRNSFLDSPRLLDADYHFRGQDGLYFAGQMTGVEATWNRRQAAYLPERIWQDSCRASRR